MNTLTRFSQDGYVMVSDLMSDAVGLLQENGEVLTETIRGGLRFPERSVPSLGKLIALPALHRQLAELGVSDPTPVRSILFDKTPEANWPVLWHQDRTIAVQEKKDVAGFGPWTRKGGEDHVHPPVAVLESIVTARIHLDPCDERNGALQVLPGSHRRGVLSPDEIADFREEEEAVTCCAESGDVLFMRPLLLHASGKSTRAGHRRILHLEYATRPLPGGLAFRSS